MTIARTLFTELMKSLSTRNGMHHVTKPDGSTVAGYARGALMCEHIFEQTKKTFELQLEAQKQAAAHAASVAPPPPQVPPNEWQMQNAGVAPVHTIVDDGKVVSPQGGNANGATLGAPVPDKGPY